MYLRPSDFYMQLLRPVGVRTRHMAPLRFYDTVTVSDFPVFNEAFSSLEQASSTDTQRYTFRIGLKDPASVVDSLAFTIDSSAYSSGVASDSVAVSLRYLIDCFFGGLSFGGGPFGGRIV